MPSSAAAFRSNAAGAGKRDSFYEKLFFLSNTSNKRLAGSLIMYEIV
jgi:hypothetical protein